MDLGSAPASTTTVPEFPTALILPLFAVIILFSVAFIRRKMPNN
jgi:hypothetical protein